jgi:oligosaccharide repeat unit polymerase
MRKVILHPSVIFGLVWGLVVGTYTLHWSELQRIDVTDGLPFIYLTVGVFAVMSVFFHVIRFVVVNNEVQHAQPLSVVTDLSLKRWFALWACLTVVEIGFSGGIPILWTLTGSSKTYFDFGIPTVHGFLNSLISSLSLISFAKYLKTKQRRHLFQSLFVVGWAVIVVTRQLIIVNLFQFLVLWVALNKVKPLSVIKLVFTVAFLVLAFGWLGDTRTGAEKFIGLAMPTDHYPDYLPSGVLWVYMYAVTPFMNLLHSIKNECGCESLYFGNTLSPLLPSFLRALILPPAKTEKGNVVSEAFNVSTAFVDPFLDSGYVGILIFTIVIASATLYFWYKKTARDLFIYCVLAQSLILTIFYNHFFSLPVITQIFWFYMILKEKRKNFSAP